MSESNWRKFLQRSGLFEADRPLRFHAPPSTDPAVVPALATHRPLRLERPPSMDRWVVPALTTLFAGAACSGWYGIPGALAFLTLWGVAVSAVTLVDESPDYKKAVVHRFEALRLPGTAPEEGSLRPKPAAPQAGTKKAVLAFLAYPGFYARLAATGFMATVATALGGGIATLFLDAPLLERYGYAAFVHALSVPAFLAAAGVAGIVRWVLRRRAAREQ